MFVNKFQRTFIYHYRTQSYKSDIYNHVFNKSFTTWFFFILKTFNFYAWQRPFQMYYQYKILTFVSSSNDRKPKDLQLWLYYRYLLTFRNVHSIWYASIKLTGSIIVLIIVCLFEISYKLRPPLTGFIQKSSFPIILSLFSFHNTEDT